MGDTQQEGETTGEMNIAGWPTRISNRMSEQINKRHAISHPSKCTCPPVKAGCPATKPTNQTHAHTLKIILHICHSHTASQLGELLAIGSSITYTNASKSMADTIKINLLFKIPRSCCATTVRFNYLYITRDRFTPASYLYVCVRLAVYICRFARVLWTRSFRDMDERMRRTIVHTYRNGAEAV